jgi:hypothetical protein
MRPPTPQPPEASASLNLGLALRAFWPPLLAWAAATAVMMALGYPPLLCATPLAWVLALYCGWAAVRGAGRGRGWVEAAVAGGALGLVQGLLFGVLSVLLSPGQADEAAGMLLRGAGIGLGGLAGGAVLALLAAAWSQRAV